MEKILRSVAAHDGHFHADEICACAFLFIFDLIDRDLIFRTRDVDVINKCEYVVDVGNIYDPQKKRFDHHQKDFKEQLSSAGMVLKYLRDEKIISNELFDYFNESFIKGVDAHDNGIVKLEKGCMSFSEVIETYVPLSLKEIKKEEYDKLFLEAFDFTVGFIKRLLNRFYY